ncbi:MAG TPA: lytic transglycosylase domain-containing protein [Acidimicrobiia bacterium]|nr:lytic transglycosylase domain-containing protein [Acidimicrobiia bacterium]
MRRALLWLLIVPVGLAVVAVLALTDGLTGDDGSSEAASNRRSGKASSSSSSSTAPRSTTTTTSGAETALTAARQPESPADLAAAIGRSENAIRASGADTPDLARWARAQQLAYRQLAHRPEWDAEVQRLLDPSLRGVVTANVEAHRRLWSLTDPKPDLPEWRIVAPPPPGELLAHYRAAEAEFGVPWQYLAGIHLVETRMGRIRGVSSAGAQGPMQFMPATWAAYGEGDVDDPADAIRAASRYLAAHGAPGDIDRALFAYNHSDHYVEAVKAHAGVMADDEAAYYGYYHWDVYYRLQSGDVLLPVGWTRADGHPGGAS